MSQKGVTNEFFVLKKRLFSSRKGHIMVYIRFQTISDSKDIIQTGKHRENTAYDTKGHQKF